MIEEPAALTELREVLRMQRMMPPTSSYFGFNLEHAALILVSHIDALTAEIADARDEADGWPDDTSLADVLRAMRSMIRERDEEIAEVRAIIGAQEDCGPAAMDYTVDAARRLVTERDTLTAERDAALRHLGTLKAAGAMELREQRDTWRARCEEGHKTFGLLHDKYRALESVVLSAAAQLGVVPPFDVRDTAPFTDAVRRVVEERDAARAVVTLMRRYLPTPGEYPGETRISVSEWESLMRRMEAIDAATLTSPGAATGGAGEGS